MQIALFQCVAYQFDTISPSTTAITKSDGDRELGRSVSVPGEGGPTLVKKTKGKMPPLITPKTNIIVVNKACPPPTDQEIKADDTSTLPCVKVKVKDTSDSTFPGKLEVKQEYSTKVKERKDGSSSSSIANVKEDNSPPSATLNVKLDDSLLRGARGKRASASHIDGKGENFASFPHAKESIEHGACHTQAEQKGKHIEASKTHSLASEELKQNLSFSDSGQSHSSKKGQTGVCDRDESGSMSLSD